MTSSTFPYTRNRYYNPVSRIQSLIQNLDAELVQLCKQCSVPKPLATQSPNSSMSGNINHNYYSGSNNGLNSFSNGTNHSANHFQTYLQDNNLVRTRNGAFPTGSHNASSDAHKRQLRNIYRTRVIDAYRNRRIFTVFGNYHTIRRALLRRGWLEKLPPNRFAKLQSLSEDTLLEHARRGNDYETVAISKMINHFPAFFIWQAKAQRDMCADVMPYRNRVRRGQILDFSTKVGLVGCAEQERWVREDGVSAMSYPRFYRLGANSFEERMGFIEDYQQTQARCLLRVLKESDGKNIIDPDRGQVLTTCIDFAIAKVKKMIRYTEHGSLDDARAKPATPAELVENQTFMANSTDILKGRSKFKCNEKVIAEYIRLATQYLEDIEKIRPDFRWDGVRNLWILKPGFQSRGIGIVIRNSLDDILQWSTNNQNRRYIVQKYIERPLLIYKTKFDIRQYMLLTISDTTVTIWMYRDCYLRFSSQEFTMDDLRESIHLTNNSVQKRYKNKQTRDPRLPKHNMWTLEQFKCHLKHTNAPEGTWSKIYNGFKQNLIAVVMASMDETELTANAFELYGCDFMIDEHYNPILIEINSTPDLSPSTEVTARICPIALKDVVRVIVDLPKNPQTQTGLFERVYEVSHSLNRNPEVEHPLELNGKAMTLLEPSARAQYSTRSKFIKKIIKTVNKTTTTIATKGKMIKDTKPDKKIKKEKSLMSIKKKLKEKTKLKKTKDHSSERETTLPRGRPSKSVLEPAVRQSLALQYTAPK